MKKIVLATALALSFVSGAALAEKVRDWHALDAVHTHVQEAIKEMDQARKANNFDMDGHGAKAEQLLHQAEQELKAAVESAKKAK